MKFTPNQIFFLVDNLVFAIFCICLTVLIVLLYKSTLNYFDSVKNIISSTEDQNALFAEVREYLDSTLGKHKIDNFEMFQNTIKAHEKRIKQYIDEHSKKNKTDE